MKYFLSSRTKLSLRTIVRRHMTSPLQRWGGGCPNSTDYQSETSSDQICWADDRPQWWDSNFQRPIISDQWKNKKCCEESIWNYLYDQKSEIYFIYEKNMKRKIEKITSDDWMKSMLLFFTFFCFCDPSPPNLVWPSQSKNNTNVYNCIFIK